MKHAKQKTVDGADLRRRLRADTVSVPMASHEFWGDFRARTQFHPQYTQEPRTVFNTALRWGAAAACCLLLVAGAGVWNFLTPKALSRIKSFDVTVPHDAVMVLRDDDSNSTLLWIVGMDEAENGEHG